MAQGDVQAQSQTRRIAVVIIVQPVAGYRRAGRFGAESDAEIGVVLTGLPADADRICRRRDEHHAGEGHKYAFFIFIYPENNNKKIPKTAKLYCRMLRNQ